MAFRTRDCIHNLPTLKNYPIQGYGAELVQIVGPTGQGVGAAPDASRSGPHDQLCPRLGVVRLQKESVEELLKVAMAALRRIAQVVPATFHGVEVPVLIDVVAEVGDSMQTLKRHRENVPQQPRKENEVKEQ